MWWLVVAAALAWLVWCRLQWSRRGLPSTSPLTCLPSIFLLETMGQSVNRSYTSLAPAPVAGTYLFFRPALLVIHPDLIHKVLVSEFSSFADRPFVFDPDNNLIDYNLFTLKSELWRLVRKKMSPAFTSGKLKWMFQGMDECVDAFIQAMQDIQGQEVEVRDAFCRLTTDVIGSCGFGLNAESIRDPDSRFRRVGRGIAVPDWWTSTKISFRFLFPRLAKLLRVSFMQEEMEFCSGVLGQTLRYRGLSGDKRHDFVQMLMELKETGKIAEDPEDTDDTVLDERVLAAQLFVFFAAGFETSATTMAFTVYLVSKHPDIQRRLREEIVATKKKYGSFSYEALADMKYLDACIKESLRLYPPMALLFRECTKECYLSEEVTVERGEVVLIPVQAVHKDPAHFPSPHLYRPERFLQGPPSPAYMPFGHGPRACIAMRFAQVEVKLALAKLLDTFTVQLVHHKMAHFEPVKMSPTSFPNVPLEGIYCRLLPHSPSPPQLTRSLIDTDSSKGSSGQVICG